MVRYNQAQSISLSAIDEQLFTEVSAEQAAVVEGGLRVQLSFIRAIRAGADGSGRDDDLYVSYNGVNAGALNGPDLTRNRPKRMRTGQVSNIATSATANGSIRVRLFDRDESSADDLIGSFTVSAAGQGTRRLTGGGSDYEISFNAF